MDLQEITEDFIEIKPGLWYNKIKGKLFNRFGREIKPNKNGYVFTKYGKASRVIYEYFNGPIPKGMQVDHKDNNRTNDKIDNYQLLDNQHNCFKRKKKTNNISGFTGVSKTSYKNNKYQARLMINGKDIYLGTFDNPEEAYKVYLEAKIKYHGEESIKPLKQLQGE
jgi:hypothetical protein